MAFVDIAVGTAAVVGIGATAYGLSGANNPQYPNLASSSQAVSNAEASMLPAYRQLASEAQLGQNTSTLNPGYTTTDAATLRQDLQSQIDLVQKQLLNPPVSRNDQAANSLRSQLQTLQSQLANVPQNGTAYLDANGNPASASQATTGANFSGFGSADIQSAIAKQMAPGELALAAKYDPQFIAAALAEENLANPQGAQARQAENALIQQQINQPIANPVAQTLTDQVQQQVSAGKGLDEFDQQALNQAVEQALNARGAAPQTGQDFSADLTTGQAGAQRQMAAIQKGVGLMQSGVTPQDVAYRREQQNLANLSNEAGGQTPVTEFGSLSGAQNGPTPNYAGQALPLAGQNQLQTAAPAYETQYAQQINQPNPWLTGVTSAINVANTAGNLGFQPLAPNAG